MNNPLALNPFKKGNKGDVEPIQKVEVEKTPNLEAVLDIYSSLNFDISWKGFKEGMFDVVNEFTLPPPEINNFLYHAANMEIKGYNRILDVDTGLFISQLINNSYNKGYNDFILNTGNYEILSLLNGLKKTKDKAKPNITILGNAGYCFAYRTYDCNITVTGNVAPDCGIESHGTKFYIHGSLGSNSGTRSVGSVFTVKGNIEPSYGWDSKGTLYRTYDKKIFDYIMKWAPKCARLLNANGKVIRRGNE